MMTSKLLRNKTLLQIIEISSEPMRPLFLKGIIINTWKRTIEKETYYFAKVKVSVSQEFRAPTIETTWPISQKQYERAKTFPYRKIKEHHTTVYFEGHIPAYSHTEH
jgi:hypothetical protein